MSDAFMESRLFLFELLTGHEPQKVAEPSRLCLFGFQQRCFCGETPQPPCTGSWRSAMPKSADVPTSWPSTQWIEDQKLSIRAEAPRRWFYLDLGSKGTGSRTRVTRLVEVSMMRT